MNQTAKLDAALADIDAANRQDPNLEGDGTPKELLYAQRMSDELMAFAPDASANLQIAARAQHIERWVIPRSEYPMDKAGYKKWRTQLAKHHAQRTVEIMQAHDFSDQDCQRVADMLQKKRLKLDSEVQALEDVICLVFIKYYLEEFAAKHDDDKLIDIIRKTWNKMSPQGHEAALKIELPPAMASLVQKALGA
ncbi:DUF4202 domain-containing protein [Gilvimarinus sp. DA14]|uniref:DUF4202 domain-containing protein n=1 Tax=Gilvimarinus sp. DA14 TaxID=2956798 RepID=UPI0020B8C8B2|nr:DUF4202 domain-containing protein [Gilvimarinus sp. DA14]UTF61412.1 DUF4202 domain-containing protein [Gilvimarinus sp. DA14]